MENAKRMKLLRLASQATLESFTMPPVYRFVILVPTNHWHGMQLDCCWSKAGNWLARDRLAKRKKEKSYLRLEEGQGP